MNGLKLAIIALILLILAQLNQWDVLDNIFFTLIALLIVGFVWSYAQPARRHRFARRAI